MPPLIDIRKLRSDIGCLVGSTSDRVEQVRLVAKYEIEAPFEFWEKGSSLKVIDFIDNEFLTGQCPDEFYQRIGSSFNPVKYLLDDSDIRTPLCKWVFSRWKKFNTNTKSKTYISKKKTNKKSKKSGVLVSSLNKVNFTEIADPNLKESILMTIANLGERPLDELVTLGLIFNWVDPRPEIVSLNDYVQPSYTRLDTGLKKEKNMYYVPCMYGGTMYKTSSKKKKQLLGRISSPILVKALKQLFPREFSDAKIEEGVTPWPEVCYFLHKSDEKHGLITGLLKNEKDKKSVKWDVLLKASAVTLSKL